MHGRIVERRRRNGADIDYLAAGGEKTAYDCLLEARRAEPHIAADTDSRSAMAAQVCSQSSPKLLYVFSKQFPIGNPANIVLAENSGFEHNSKVSCGQKVSGKGFRAWSLCCDRGTIPTPSLTPTI
jgi:hypothetical protein